MRLLILVAALLCVVPGHAQVRPMPPQEPASRPPAPVRPGTPTQPRQPATVQPRMAPALGPNTTDHGVRIAPLEIPRGAVAVPSGQPGGGRSVPVTFTGLPPDTVVQVLAENDTREFRRTVSYPRAGELHDGSPGARQWAERLRGRRLVSFSGYTSGGSSGGFNSQTELRLYAGGQFDYSHSSSVSVYVEGLSGGSSDAQNLSGMWRVISLGAQPTLEPITEEGRYQDPLEAVGNEIRIGGQRLRIAE